MPRHHVVNCNRCGGSGHYAKTCTGETQAPDAPKMWTGRAQPKCSLCKRHGHRRSQCAARDIGAAVPADAVRPAPMVIKHGDRFTIAEDFTETETGRRWLGDETWEAVSPARAAGAWRLRRVPDGKLATGHPALHPFVQALAGGPSLARDWRVGVHDPREAAA